MNMKTIVFKGDDTVLTGKEIIKVLKELGGIDFYKFENEIPITTDYISTDVLYFYINTNDNIIKCDTEFPFGYTLLNIKNFDIMDCISSDKIKDTINILNNMNKNAENLKKDMIKTLEHIELLKTLGYNDDGNIKKITDNHYQSITEIDNIIDKNTYRINYLKSKNH